MVAVEQPRAECGHSTLLTQQCGKCLRWCCPECYAPWTALACTQCRADARGPAIDAGVPPADARCRGRAHLRAPAAGSHGHRRPGDRVDVRRLAARVADLERRLHELRPGP
jgi:hypothetical protein